MIEPMPGVVNLRPYIENYRASDGSPVIRHVSAGGESGPGARGCDERTEDCTIFRESFSTSCDNIRKI